MSVRQEAQSRLPVERVSFRKRVSKKTVDSVAASPPAVYLAKKLVPRILEKSTPQLSEFIGMEHIEELEPFLDAGYNFRLMFSHESQADAGPMIIIADAVRGRYPERIKKFVLPVAESMEGGQQGSPLKTLYTKGVIPTFEKHQIFADDMTSDNDIESRDMQRTSDTVGIRTVMGFKRKTIGIILYPEAVMTGGRFTSPDSERVNGLQNPARSAVAAIDKDIEWNENIVYLAVSIHGGYEVFSPRTKFFTQQGVEMIVNPMVYKIGNMQMSEKPIVAQINKPFTSHDIRSSGKQGAQFIMEKIAEVHPQHARGKFSYVS